MPNPIPSWAQSSVDPSQVSLTVESIGKVLVGVLAWYLVSKGMDAATAQSQLQAIVDLIAQGIPMVFILWHTMTGVWGLVRKLIPRTASTASVPPQAQL